MSVWTYTENAPEWATPLAECWSWGLNCNPDGNPWTALLDLVGFTEDELGVRLFPWSGSEWSLGWMELGYLSAALAVWADRPRECAEWVAGLWGSEDELDD